MVVEAAPPERISYILALFRKHQPLVDCATDAIERRYLQSVLQKVDPVVFTDVAVDQLCLHFLPAGTALEATTPIPLEEFMTALFAARAAPNETALSEKIGVAVAEEVDVLRVRNPAGELILHWGASQLGEAGLAALEEQVKIASGKERCEVKLLAGGQHLQDDETLRQLLQAGDPVEIVAIAQALPALDEDRPPLEQLETLRRMLFARNREVQTEGARHIRKILSIENAPPIEEIIAADVAPHLIELSQLADSPQLQFESLWALTNIASGSTEHTRFIVDRGAVPAFVECLRSPNEDVREQAVWGLGNVAGDSVPFRDLVLNSGALNPLLALITGDEPKASFLRNATWVLSNFCRGRPPVVMEMVAQALPVLSRLIHGDDDEVLADACWALSYLSDGQNARIQAVLDVGVAQQMVDLLSRDNLSIVSPALRVVGNIVSGDDMQTETVLRCGVLRVIPTLLSCTKASIRKEACWTLSNILAGGRDQIQQVIDHGLLVQVSALMMEGHDQNIAKEAAWALSNCAEGGSSDQVRVLVASNAFPAFFATLRTHHHARQICEVVVNGIYRILQCGETQDQFAARALRECPDAFDVLDLVLQSVGEITNSESVREQLESAAAEPAAATAAEQQASLASGSDDFASAATTEVAGTGFVDAAITEPAVEGRSDLTAPGVEGGDEQVAIAEAAAAAGPVITTSDGPDGGGDAAGEIYRVAVRRAPGREVGLAAIAHLLVARPRPGTLLEEWSVANPQTPVADGDVVLEVNGVGSDGIDAIKAQLEAADLIELIFRRAPASFM
mmetsp:Transcript_134909/g.336645  ORF Transcript_134909/g.336645 Transcript_134909/m.336645 type:complete len:794 (-) Transcript_134909:197-2578(-)